MASTSNAKNAGQRPSKKLLLLPSPVYTEEWNGENVVANPLTGYPYHRAIEYAGFAYHQFVINKLKLLNSDGDKPSEQKESNKKKRADKKKQSKESIDDDDNTPMDSEMRERLKAKKKNATTSEDWYDILGIGHLRWKATQQQIKNAYRKACLVHHPDKNMVHTEEGDQPDDTMFKLVTKAYEVLGDEKKRSAYDSAETFDDSIPTDFPDGADFYEFFGSHFTKWSRWSARQPVPEIGTERTGWEQVEKFYQFWTTFKSNRDFSFQDEYDANTAETREEKRWIERQNEKKREKSKKEEKAKIQRLVELAQRRDPRVKKRKEYLELERKRKEMKAALDEERKILAAAKREEERKEKAEAEERRRQKEQSAIAAQKKKKREAFEAEKVRLRELCSPHTTILLGTHVATDSDKIDPVAVEVIITRATFEELQALNNELEPVKDSFQDFRRIFNLKHDQYKPKVEPKKQKAAAATPKTASNAATSTATTTKPTVTTPPRDWTPAELSLLAKGIAKYPGGTSQRWKLISDVVGTRTPEEVQIKTAELRKLEGSKTARPTESYYDEFLQKTMQDKEKKVGGNLDAIVGEATKRFDSTIQTKQPPTEAAAATSGTSSSSWSLEQQKALEGGLRTFSAKDPERWVKIAGVVPGKTKEECQERFKHIVAQLKAKQAAVQQRNK